MPRKSKGMPRNFKGMPLNFRGRFDESSPSTSARDGPFSRTCGQWSQRRARQRNGQVGDLPSSAAYGAAGSVAAAVALIAASVGFTPAWVSTISAAAAGGVGRPSWGALRRPGGRNWPS